MSAHCEEFSVGRELHNLTPLLRMKKSRDSNRKVIVIVDEDISVIVADSHVVVVAGVCDGSSLLMRRVIAKSGCCRLDLLGLVRIASVHLLGPNFSRSNVPSVSDTVLVELVVISTSQECSLFSDDFEAPAFAIVVGHVLGSMLVSINVNGANSSVVVANEYLPVHVVQGRCNEVVLERDLSQILKLALVDRVNGKFVVLACGNDHAF